MVGFTLFLVYIGLFTAWVLRRLIPAVRAGVQPSHWFVVACFAAGFVGYLATGTCTDNYFIILWKEWTMTVLGATVAGCLAGEAVAPTARAPAIGDD